MEVSCPWLSVVPRAIFCRAFIREKLSLLTELKLGPSGSKDWRELFLWTNLSLTSISKYPPFCFGRLKRLRMLGMCQLALSLVGEVKITKLFI